MKIGERVASGEWQHRAGMADYRAEWLTDVLVERATWRGRATSPPRYPLPAVGRVQPGSVWTRFWFRREDQVVDKYFGPDRAPVGYYAPVCLPIEQQGDQLVARPVGLALWMDPDGRVTVVGEPEFDAAAESGELAPVLLEHAEHRIRELTTVAAQRRFPPALVRNFTLVTGDNA